MRRKRLHRQIFPTYLILIVACLLISGWLTTRLFRQFYFEQLTSDLKTRMILVKEGLERQLVTLPNASLDSLCKSLGHLSGTRITIIDSLGRVLGDTEENSARMENHSDRPEFQQALAGTLGSSTRYSPTLKERMLYLAVPFTPAGGSRGALRVALPTAVINDALYRIYGQIALVAVIISLLGAGLSYWVSRRLSQPLAEMREGAQLFAQGDFSRKLLLPDSEEMGALAATLNQMAEQLSARISDITRKHEELEAVLSSMMEGVLAVDMEERIISANLAARNMLDIRLEELQGRFIQEAIPSLDFQRFVARLLKSQQRIEEEMVLGGGRFVLQAHGTLLRAAGDQEIGALIVLNDITRLRRLENLRKEFVANVSHELRTPITAIQGFVETLQEGAVQDEAQAAHFLGIIRRHVGRLNAIIEDLLSLSKLEQSAERGEINLEEEDLKEVLHAALQNTEARAAAKNLKYQVAVEGMLRARCNPTLLEQALSNLLDNAIKYSPPENEIRVGVERTEGELILFVQDFGCGIEAEHLPRIFERFYRVDKNRSREVGGTGLGLAIVKHIALAHGGRVSVESHPGKGSIFRLHLLRPDV